MKPLQLNRELMTYICMCTPPKETPLHVLVRRHILVMAMLVCLTFGWGSSIVYIILYIKTDLRSALYAIFQIAAEFSAEFTALSSYLRPDASLTVFLKFNHIREHVIDYKKDGAKCFTSVDDFCYKLTKFLVQTILIIYIIASILQFILNAMYCHYRDDGIDGIDPQCLFIPYKIAAPWNQETFSERSRMIVFCAMQGTIYTYVITTFLSFFVSMSLQFNAFRIYLKGLIDELDDAVNSTNRSQNFLLMLNNSISFHAIIKDLFWSAAEVFNSYSFVQIMSAVVFMSSNIMNLDLSANDPGADLVFIFYATIMALLNLYLYCYFGDFTTTNFEQFPKYFFQSDWYKLPSHLQKYYILMIANSNIPVTFKGFGVVSLNLETFLKVLKTSSSYYLILKAAAFE